MFGNVKNYSDLCWRKDCLGSARYPEERDIISTHATPTYLALSTTARKGESHKIALKGFPLGAFLFSAQGERNAERRKQIVVEL